jgi:predicted Zn-dependent peptidase
MVFVNWANAHSTIGSMEDLDRATVADVREFFQTYYAPTNAVLAVAGDIDSAQAEALVRRYFATIPRQPTPPPVDVNEPTGVAKQKGVVSDQHADMPAVALAWKIPPRRSADSYALALIKSLLTDGESARLYQKLVKEKAVALELEGTLEERRGPGQLAIFTIHKPEVRPEQIQAMIEAEIERIKRDGVPVEELLKVKNQYRLSRFSGGGGEGEYASLQTALGRALALAEFAMFDGDPSLINTEIDRYLAVTPDQVREAARRHLGTVNRSALYIRVEPSGGSKTR